jgi:hypothetical protein
MDTDDLRVPHSEVHPAVGDADGLGAPERDDVSFQEEKDRAACELRAIHSLRMVIEDRHVSRGVEELVRPGAFRQNLLGTLVRMTLELIRPCLKLSTCSIS